MKLATKIVILAAVLPMVMYVQAAHAPQEATKAVVDMAAYQPVMIDTYARRIFSFVPSLCGAVVATKLAHHAVFQHRKQDFTSLVKNNGGVGLATFVVLYTILNYCFKKSLGPKAYLDFQKLRLSIILKMPLAVTVLDLAGKTKKITSDMVIGEINALYDNSPFAYTMLQNDVQKMVEHIAQTAGMLLVLTQTHDVRAGGMLPEISTMMTQLRRLFLELMVCFDIYTMHRATPVQFSSLNAQIAHTKQLLNLP